MPVAASLGIVTASSASSVAVITPAAILVAVVPVVIVTSPVSAGMRATGMVPVARSAASRFVRFAPDMAGSGPG